jgi:DNA-binding winged helix-turn-helix (wHTH) protein
VPLRFGDCRLDVDARRLFRASREVHLSPKAFELLKLLAQTRPRALSKEELLERVWPGVFVSDASLASVINQVRNGVGDSARRPRIIRTVHGYGYAFVADVDDDAGPAKPARSPNRSAYYLVLGHRTFLVDEGEHIVGREPSVSVWLDSPKVSRHHAKIVVKGERATIEDLKSKNGTFVGGGRIRTAVALEAGETIEVGPFALEVRKISASRSTETAASRTKPSR